MCHVVCRRGCCRHLQVSRGMTSQPQRCDDCCWFYPRTSTRPNRCSHLLAAASDSLPTGDRALVICAYSLLVMIKPCHCWAGRLWTDHAGASSGPSRRLAGPAVGNAGRLCCRRPHHKWQVSWLFTTFDDAACAAADNDQNQTICLPFIGLAARLQHLSLSVGRDTAMAAC